MNIGVRYYSRTGNTRQIAEAVAAAAGCKAETVEIPLEGDVDVLFLGGGIYWGKIPKVMKEYIKGLIPERVGRVAVFTTAGINCDACKVYQTYLQNHDFKVFHDGFFSKEKEVSEEHRIQEAGTFVRRILSKAKDEGI